MLRKGRKVEVPPAGAVSNEYIKKWAKKHNPIITQEMKDDVDIIYFMDRL